MTATVTSASLAPLLVGYLSGDVSDDAMAQFDDLFDSVDASAAERLAFAQFYLDALASGDYANALPRPAEVPGILSAIHA